MTDQATPATPHDPLARTAAPIGSNTAQPIIIVGPYGFGKTRLARVIAAYLGKSNMVECWLIGDAVPADTALFSSDTFLAGYTNYRGPHTVNGVQIMQFDGVLAALGRDLPPSQPASDERLQKDNLMMFHVLNLVDAEMEQSGTPSPATMAQVRDVIKIISDESATAKQTKTFISTLATVCAKQRAAGGEKESCAMTFMALLADHFKKHGDAVLGNKILSVVQRSAT